MLSLRGGGGRPGAGLAGGGRGGSTLPPPGLIEDEEEDQDHVYLLDTQERIKDSGLILYPPWRKIPITPTTERVLNQKQRQVQVSMWESKTRT